MERKRRRAKRTAEVDYDRDADIAVPRERGDDRVVIMDEDAAPPLTDLEYLEDERPPHYGD